MVPYENERAGLAAIRTISNSGIVDEFRSQLKTWPPGELLPLPPFHPLPDVPPRPYVLAIDGSNVYFRVDGRYPGTEIGLVALGIVWIKARQLLSLKRSPQSGAVDPRALRATEKGITLAVALPGRNAQRNDEASPERWFRQATNAHLNSAPFGGESLAQTLHAILPGRTVRCPNTRCGEAAVELPEPGQQGRCPGCGEPVWLTDGLRIHEQFIEESVVSDCHRQFRNALEILALVNLIRNWSRDPRGRKRLSETAFVKDGPLAAFEGLSVLGRAVRQELERIQAELDDHPEGARLLVMAGVKSGLFVEHAFALDRAPEPNKRMPKGHYWLPDNSYIREQIVAGTVQNSRPWGEMTYFGRPVVIKTHGGQRLVLNIAQPEVRGVLTDAPPPHGLGEALAIANALGIGTDQFLPLRRAHAHAAIPLGHGADIVRKLAR